MSLYDIPLRTIDDADASLREHKGKAVLVVNVASRCGFTPQYEGLQALHDRYADRGFTVLGFPCNQFLGQEPGSHQEIVSYCSTTFGVSFPLFAKCEVIGEDRHPLFAELTKVPDAEGEAGDVKWNFEKFLIDPSGKPVARFRTQVEPLDESVVQVIEASLPRLKVGQRGVH
jgi:glutathione peroxidase